VLIRALLLALALVLCVPAAAHATGVFEESGPTVIYTASPGDVDQIAAFETPTTLRFTRFGGAGLGPGPGCSFVSGDSDTIDCPKIGITSVVLNLGDQDDVASVSPSLGLTVIFNGGDGNDGLFGGGGLDIFNGGAGNDNIVSRDSHGEQVDCGSGHDTAISDDADTRISCEEVEGDADGDGVRHPLDCDDTNPLTHPGAVDIPRTASTRTARAPTRSSPTATATARRGRRTATTPTPRSTRARARSSATRSTRTATGASTRSRR
jgi:hypothetical protein